MLTTLCSELYERGHRNIWIRCNHTVLFKSNPHIKLVLAPGTLLSVPLLKLFKVKTAHPVYTQYQPATDRDIIPEKHIVLKMADQVGLKGAIKNKPVFILDKVEEAKGEIVPNQVVIISSAMAAAFPMRNKEWITERYQDLVNKLNVTYNFIQLGSASDTPLENVLDMRGKTTIRETAAILKKSKLLVSHVGFMMHLARAVDCRAVIIYGGREMPEQSGYGCFHNIYSPVACSPCWLHNRCDFDHRCMTMINTEVVKNAIDEQMKLTGEPLPVDILYND